MESTSEEAMDLSPIELLPTEILQKILSYLPVRDRVRVERVCKIWKNVSTEKVWRDKQVLIIVSSSSENYMQFFHPLRASNKSSKFNTMRENKLYIGAEELGIIKSLISRAGQHIEQLIFYPGSGGDLALLIIATFCHNIKSIRFDGITKSNAEIFSWLVRSNEQLHSISSFGVATIVKILPLRDWKSLDIGTVTKLEEEDEWEEKAIALIENSPSLENFCAFNWTPRILTAISNCEQLKKIEFPIHVDRVMDDLMLATSLLNRLTCLEVNIHGQYDENMIVNLLRYCINLESLHLLFWNYELPHAVEGAVLAHPKLESLQIYDSKLTDATLSHLGKFKYLRLKNELDPITEDGILKMIANSECLEKLEIPRMIVTMEFFERLILSARKYRKILKITVNPRIYEKALAICKGSRILITAELHNLEGDIENWLS